jgi:hypothetical protein
VVRLQKIFEDNWDEFVKVYNVRPIVDSEVRKVIACGKIENGFSLYECECGHFKIVPFRCKSRVCNCCGYQYQRYRADKLNSKLINCNHRHIVFTIAEELRIFFRRDRNLLNLLFKSSADTISAWLKSRNKSQNLTCGMVSTLHTFGRDLKWNPHIHMLVSLCAQGNGIPFKFFNFIPFEMLRKRFMTTLLFYLKKALRNSQYSYTFNALVNILYKIKNNGFYVYAYAKITSSQNVINYMVRYIGRPVIAQKRILKYENGFVTFCYNRHEDNKYIEETLPVFDFIKKVIIHIPEKYFNMIRHYGLYAKSHCLRLMNKKIPARLHRQLNLWFLRIWQSFGYNPLKCTCGKIMKFSEFFFPNTS